MVKDFIVLDIETTGLKPEVEKITEIAAIKIIDNKVADTYTQLINPEIPISDRIVEITGITDEMVKDKPSIEKIFVDFLGFTDGFDIMGHNILFDYSFLKVNACRLGYKFDKKGIDTLGLAKRFEPGLRSRSLTSLIDYFGIERENAHRAYDDAMATYDLYTIFKDRYYSDEEHRYFEPTELIYRVKKSEPITNKQARYLDALVKGHNLSLDKEIKAYTKSEASRLIDKIILKHGRLF